MSNEHEKVNYIELSAFDLEATKAFFTTVFNWQFTDFGADYCDVADVGINVGFFRAATASTTATGGALVVFYSEDLEKTQRKVLAAGGLLSKPTFPFPGGRRFQFTEPSGNEFGIWTDRELDH